MKGYLLDTNIVLNALGRPHLLSRRAKAAVRSGPNVVSVLVYWEVMLKTMKGLLLVGYPQAWWQDTLDILCATSLPLKPEHVTGVDGLPFHHRDPFDRMLIAQAAVEDLTLVTSDREISKYKSNRIRVIV